MKISYLPEGSRVVAKVRTAVHWASVARRKDEAIAKVDLDAVACFPDSVNILVQGGDGGWSYVEHFRVKIEDFLGYPPPPHVTGTSGCLSIRLHWPMIRH